MENRDFREFWALLFDTRSIQRYIFAGSQLKTNIGASYLVDRVFDAHLLPAVRDILGEEALDDTTWREVEQPDWTQQEKPARVGYIGGGNAFLLLDGEIEEDRVRAIVTRFTERLLVACPGLKTGAAYGRLALRPDGSFVEAAAQEKKLFGQQDGRMDFSLLFQRLRGAQNTVLPCVNVFYTGLTLSSGGEAATHDEAGLGRFVSAEEAAKLAAATRSFREEAPAERALRENLRQSLDAAEREDFLSGYAFPASFDRLGQRETENYLAVVHIDGNNMGKQFAGLRTLTERKNRSLAVRGKTVRAFAELVKEITGEYESYGAYLDTRPRREGEPRDLPVRPLVLGGDDMTFVCAAKVAFLYARRLMAKLKTSGITSCAGIAILKTSYPFSRGYALAEELCGAAKKKMRAQDGDSCWLDFAILHGEQAPTLAGIRAQEYRGARGSLHFGPYQVDGRSTRARSLAALLEAVAKLRTALPQSKIKELRAVLAHGEAAQRAFLAQLASLRREERASLPAVAAWQRYEEELFVAGETPYVDVIELLDFIPRQQDEEG